MKTMQAEHSKQHDKSSTISTILRSSTKKIVINSKMLATQLKFCLPPYRQYSIGVTTGVAFCGVVGHPQRHEYTVIGQKVNMAARLMMSFPNTVVCDESTQTKSGLATSQFSLQPPVTLKGISNPEKIYTLLTERYTYMYMYMCMYNIMYTI